MTAGVAVAVRLFTRSTSLRNAAGRLSSGAKTSPFRLPATKPISHRIFRCPVELSVCLERVEPFHTVSASAFLTSVVILSHRAIGWLPEGFWGLIIVTFEISLLSLIKVHEMMRILFCSRQFETIHEIRRQTRTLRRVE